MNPPTTLKDLVEKSTLKTSSFAIVRAAADIYRENPAILGELTSVALSTVEDVIHAVNSTDAVTRTVMLADWQRMVMAHTPADATPIERMLAMDVATAWLTLQVVTTRYAIHTKGGETITASAHWDHLLDAAQRRYLRAVETLARVRRIERLGPALQINIGAQQVNTVTP